MQDLHTASADFFEREARICKKLAESINKSISSNVPNLDKDVIHFQLWNAVAKVAEHHIKQHKEAFIEQYNIDASKPHPNGPIAGGEIAVLNCEVRKGGTIMSTTAFINELRKAGVSQVNIDACKERATKLKSNSIILSVTPRV